MINAPQDERNFPVFAFDTEIFVNKCCWSAVIEGEVPIEVTNVTANHFARNDPRRDTDSEFAPSKKDVRCSESGS